ncbi:MAG: response regulator [Planctomycetota bacterium]|nr:response regulator [Planctomycetota bacterium]
MARALFIVVSNEMPDHHKRGRGGSHGTLSQSCAGRAYFSFRECVNYKHSITTIIPVVSGLSQTYSLRAGDRGFEGLAMEYGKNDVRVLVVEDNPTISRALVVLLRDEGYVPVVFDAGLPAVEYLRDHCPDIALIDIHLPDISGLELSKQLRDFHGNDVPVIILSGDTSIDTLRTLPQVGATYFFSKPVNISTLLTFLKECDARRQIAKA